MKHVIVLIALVILNIGCAKELKPQEQMQDSIIDPNLLPYLQAFGNIATTKGIMLDVEHLTMTFSENMPNAYTLAYCSISKKGPNVVIKQSKWFEMNIVERELLVFHELGHCLMKLNHNDMKINNTPVSIMNTYFIGGSTYGQYKDMYLTQLFGK